MSQIDQAHHAENDRKAERGKAEHSAEQNARTQSCWKLTLMSGMSLSSRIKAAETGNRRSFGPSARRSRSFRSATDSETIGSFAVWFSSNLIGPTT